MESNSNRSETLVKLAERLRLHNPTDPFYWNLTVTDHSLDSSSNTTNNHIQTQSSRIQECTVNEVVLKEQELKPEVGTDQIGNNSRRAKSNRAAVLVCLFEDQEGHLRVVLTKRASTLSTHSGEVSLPGGKVEEGDADDIETALREAEEEIGLDRSIVDVVTVLESFTTKKGITVIPVVGILWDRNAFDPVINTAEVETIFDAPLEMFLKDENRREKEFEYMGDEYVLQFFDHETENEKYTIWALTAGILIKAASVVYQRPPDFQERRPQFWRRSRQ